MTLQYRFVETPHEGPLPAWKDEDSERNGPSLCLSTSNLGGYFEVREKPSFEPGYYRLIKNAAVQGHNPARGYAQWWDHEPDLFFWEPVDVTPRG